jgi:hypothetical protein
MRWLLPLTALAAVGCHFDAEVFRDEFAAETCTTLSSCQEVYFEATWPNEAACYDQQLALLEGDPRAASCELDLGVAKECLAALKHTNCDQFVEGDWYTECVDLYPCE